MMLSRSTTSSLAPWIMGAWAVLLAASFCGAQVPDYDFDWITVTHSGNPGYAGPDPYHFVTGRGSVAYEYRIPRLEVTTSQWLNFVNTFSTQSDEFVNFAWPAFWGAEIDTSYSGPGRRHRLRTDVSNPGMLPVAGIDWRESAMFCNWLHNDKSSDLSAIADGAYDTSTFHTNPDGTFTDQRAHHPDARFWIPTLDEWLKAVHYDANRFGPGDGGYWQLPNGTDDPLIPGPPGVGQANTGFTLPNFGHWDIPLGAYPDVTTPFGLLDAAGAAAEWLEDVSFATPPQDRLTDGSYAGSMLHEAEDLVWIVSSSRPQFGASWFGLRIASQVPAPGSTALLATLALLFVKRRRS